ncbi:MAG: hypothetical protein ACLR8P_06200 [Clostridium fessum]
MDSSIDLTREILEEKSLGIDEDGFQRSDETPEREQARCGRKTTNYMGADVTVYSNPRSKSIATEFIG